MDSYPRWKPIGHKTQSNLFLQAWKKNKLHHAWLFHGIKGVGKAGVAHYLSRFILVNKSPKVSLDQTQSHLNLLDENPENILDVSFENPDISLYFARSNPNFIHISKDSDKASITVDQIREMCRQLEKKYDDNYRIIIIDSVDDLNKTAANSLLKTLEEPPQNTIFFLISHNPDQLLPTITSRCRQLRFVPLEKDAMSRLLDMNNFYSSDNQKEMIIWLCDGVAGRAFQLATIEGQELWQDVFNIFSRLIRKDFSQLSLFCSKYGKKNAPNKEYFTLLLTFWLHLIRAGCLHAAQYDKNLPAEIKNLLSDITYKKQDRWLQLWDKTVMISHQLLLEDIDKIAGLSRMLLLTSKL